MTHRLCHLLPFVGHFKCHSGRLEDWPRLTGILPFPHRQYKIIFSKLKLELSSVGDLLLVILLVVGNCTARCLPLRDLDAWYLALLVSVWQSLLLTFSMTLRQLNEVTFTLTNRIHNYKPIIVSCVNTEGCCTIADCLGLLGVGVSHGGNVWWILSSDYLKGITYLFALSTLPTCMWWYCFSIYLTAGTMEGRESFTCVYRALWCTKWKFL